MDLNYALPPWRRPLRRLSLFGDRPTTTSVGPLKAEPHTQLGGRYTAVDAEDGVIGMDLSEWATILDGTLGHACGGPCDSRVPAWDYRPAA
jgi:hypothetical protein